jgi:hypothetical protein
MQNFSPKPIFPQGTLWKGENFSIPKFDNHKGKKKLKNEKFFFFLK